MLEAPLKDARQQCFGSCIPHVIRDLLALMHPTDQEYVTTCHPQIPMIHTG